MGVVYRAHDPVIGRDVAVKTMHLSEQGTGMSREELIARFQTEARAAGLLTHPNIVVVYDAGEEEGIFYITMELVEGRSLQTLLDARQLFPLARTMKVMEQVCSALDFAHQRNVIHRDIKPANLMMTADDTVKITDFGTAKILQFGTAQTAHVMGTPSYMSPEQVKGKPVDGRSDIFSLGVILYELMTGEKPFPGQNITTVIYKIINEEPIPPRSLDSSIHAGLSDVIARALAKDPAARFQSCHELLDALKNYRDLVKPEATVRMASAKIPAVIEGTRPLAQPSSPPIFAPANTSEAPAPSFRVIVKAEDKTPNRRAGTLLTLILLGIIGYAGYRVWPQLLDIWQHMHDPAEKSVAPAKALTAIPAPDAAIHESQGDQANPSTPAAQEMTIPAAEQNSVSSQPPPLKASENTADAAPVPVVNIEKPRQAAKPVTPFVAPGASALKATLSSELADISLADKVKIVATGNALILSGQLTPRDHSKLLTLLHDVPGGVKVVDDIGYADEAAQAPQNAQAGWVWIRSTPWGAKISVDGTDTGLRTPARVEVPKGEHEIQLSRRGFGSVSRSVLIQPGQNMQFTERLGAQ
jgi:serine/threonine-protein kinase